MNIRPLIKSLRALLLAMIATNSLAHGAAPAPDNLDGSRQRIEASDFRVVGRLVSVGANGARVSHKVRLKGHWFPDGMMLLFEVTDPAPERMRLLVHMTPAGVLTLESGKPGAPPAKLSADHLHDALAGTAFTIEDLTDPQFFWREQTTLTPQKFGTHDCSVLKSVPSPDDHSAYGSVASWVTMIDSKTAYPIHISKFSRSGATKDFTSFGLRQVSGVWSATQVEAKIEGQPGSSLLFFDRGSPKAHLTRKDFDLGQPFAADEAP